MALARIITRSQACSRELALDLLARGYAVEIVSPDRIPDNIADLELRVEEDPGNQLVATVETHDGTRSASLEFIHHLKAPMADFLRRAPETVEVVRLSEDPVRFDIVPAVEECELRIQELDLPAEATPPVRSAVFAPVPIPVDLNSPELSLYEQSREEDAPLLSLPDSLPPRSQETVTVTEEPIPFTEEVSTIAPPIVPSTTRAPETVHAMLEPSRGNRFAGWQRRTALTFVGMVSLALALGFGLRRAEKTSTQIPQVISAQKVSASSTGRSLLTTAGAEKNTPKASASIPRQVSNSSGLPPALRSGADSDQTLKHSTLPKAEAATVRIPIVSEKAGGKKRAGETGKARHHGEDIIAHDTVTYLDDHYRPVPKSKVAKQSARPRPALRKHDGIVAANSVTYLNKTQTPKPPK
jgi:hypothetical protein